MNKHELINLVIKNISDAGDGDFTVNLVDGRKIYFFVEGDCCSHSWIEHFETPSDIEGAVIIDIEHLEGDLMPGEKEPSPYDHRQYYKTVIKTSKGDIDIEYRNDSNGFYGGYIDWRWVE